MWKHLLAIPELFGRLRFIDLRSGSTAWVANIGDEDVISISPGMDRIGSFDGSLSLYDLVQREVVEKRVFPAGVWRAEAWGTRDIAGCMYEGFVIRDAATTTTETLPHHNSLAYGLAKSENLLATASFYDSQLCFWRLPS